MTDLFELFYHHWETFAIRKDSWYEATITHKQILNSLNEKGHMDKNPDWIKSTIMNIRRTKIKARGLTSYVQIVAGNRQSHTYIIRIKKLNISPDTP